MLQIHQISSIVQKKLMEACMQHLIMYIKTYAPDGQMQLIESLAVKVNKVNDVGDNTSTTSDDCNKTLPPPTLHSNAFLKFSILMIISFFIVLLPILLTFPGIFQ